MKSLPWIALAACLLPGSAALTASEPTNRQVESLERQIAALRAELLAVRKVAVMNVDGSTLAAAGVSRKDVSPARRVVLEAGDELLLRVGPASILLRKDGTVVVRGVNVSVDGAAVVAIKGPRIENN